MARAGDGDSKLRIFTSQKRCLIQVLLATTYYEVLYIAYYLSLEKAFRPAVTA
jgi:hypothetical protein